MLAAGLASLAGCAAIERDMVAEAVRLEITPGMAALFYAIVKGMAEVATLAAPELAPLVKASFAALDGPMAKIEAGIATAEDVATVVSGAVQASLHVAPNVLMTPA